MNQITTSVHRLLMAHVQRSPFSGDKTVSRHTQTAFSLDGMDRLGFETTDGVSWRNHLLVSRYSHGRGKVLRIEEASLSAFDNLL